MLLVHDLVLKKGENASHFSGGLLLLDDAIFYDTHGEMLAE